jgi:hypothetical protein
MTTEATVSDEHVEMRTARAAVLTNGYAPLLRHEILSRSDIVDVSGIATEGMIRLGDIVSFPQSALFEAIATAYDQVSTPVIASMTGEEWKVAYLATAKPPTITVECGNQRVTMPEFSLLRPDSASRVAAFRLLAEAHGLRGDHAERWYALLSQRLPTDDELTAAIDDLAQTPVSNYGLIRDSLSRGGLAIDTMVPSKESYYLRLLGNISIGDDFEQNLARVTAPFLSALLANGDRQSFGLAWLLCSHPSVSGIIDQVWEGDDTVLADSLTWLVSSGDPISRTGAVEVGLRRVGKCPELAQPLGELIRVLAGGEDDAMNDTFDLLAALFSCIYGHMARRRILAHWPPYARRWAALAQASLVNRHFIEGDQDRDGFVSWLRGVGQEYWKLQVLLDLRTEPRWFPELNSADQWRNELLGRIVHVARLCSETIGTFSFAARLLDEGPESLASRINKVAMSLPGPLEGHLVAPIELSPVDIAEIEERLQAAIDTGPFNELVSVTMVLGVPDRLPDLAADVIERHHYQIPTAEDDPIFPCLAGLALIAAVSRNTRLSNAVFAVLRGTDRLRPGQLTADDAFHIGVIASAAHAELSKWAECLGQFMTELALRDLSREEAVMLQSHVSAMCHLEPSLWRTCGSAKAAFGLVAGE